MRSTASSFRCDLLGIRPLLDPCPSRRRWSARYGVDDRLEKILYTRIKKPIGSEVVDDSFVRTRGGLQPDWDKGLSLFVARQLLGEFANGGGVLVGWQIDSDLGAMRFDMAAEQAHDAEKYPPFGRRHAVPLVDDGYVTL